MGFRIHIRTLLRSRAILTTAVLLLGVGLGVDLTLFNSVYALLWRPLNFQEPDRLATLRGRSQSGDVSLIMTGREAWTLRSQPDIISQIGLTGRRRLVSLIQADDSADMASTSVDSGYFRVLGLRPVMGRLFGAEENLGESPEQPLILTESAW
jgi:hypothetical protein